MGKEKPPSKKNNNPKDRTWPVTDGLEYEDVLIVQYNPDQMARCIDEIYTRYYDITDDGAYGDPGNKLQTKEEFEKAFSEDFASVGITLTAEKIAQFYEYELRDSLIPSDNKNVPEVAVLLKLLQDEGDHQLFRKLASEYIEENLPEIIGRFYGFFVAEVMDYALRALEMEKDASEYRKPQIEDIKLYTNIPGMKLKERLGAQQRGGSEKGIDPTVLTRHYDSWLPVWQEAYRLYKALKRGKQGKEIRYKLLHDRFKDLPLDLLKGFDLDKYYNTPSYLAIEHAKRLSESEAKISKKDYSPRYLLTLVTNYRRELGKPDPRSK